MQNFLKTFKKLVEEPEVRSDNNVFRLHYKFSTVLFLMFSILLSSKQFFGDPISCTAESDKEIVNVFCWVSGTFIIEDNYLNERYLRAHNVHKLGNPVGKTTYTLYYYQWVFLLFGIQALMFYFPRYLWNTWEGKRMGQLLNDLCGPLVTDKWTSVYKDKMKVFIMNNDNHDVSVYRFAFCEVLHLFNLVAQTYLMEWYLQGKFSRYGLEVLRKPWPLANDDVFPKRTKCIWEMYGPSGEIVNRDALCVLPLNVLNEKFFLIIWFWLLIMFVLSIGALIYRMLVLFWVQFRVYLLLAQVRSLDRKKMVLIGKSLSPGQFFLLYNIGKNMNPIIYKELLLAVYDHLELKGFEHIHKV